MANWAWGDMGSEMAIGVIADIGITGVLAAAGATVGGPVGLAVGLVAGAAISALSVSQRADVSIEELIERIEALDYEKTRYKLLVRNWIENLKQYQGALQEPITAVDPENRGKLAKKKIEDLMALKKFLDVMWPDWMKKDGVKETIRDWGFDPSDFEYTFKKVYGIVSQMLKQINERSKNAAAQVLSTQPEPIDKLYTEVSTLAAQIKMTWAAPEFTPEEKQLLESAKRLRAGQVKDVEEVKNTVSGLGKLRKDLKQLLEEAKKRAQRHKRSDIERDIEKTAVSLPDAPTPKEQKTTRTKKRTPGRAVVVKSPATQKLQMLINKAAAALGLSLTVMPDGTYGDKTASAMVAIIKSSPKMTAYFRSNGFSENIASDIKLMNSYNGAFIGLATRLMNKLFEPVPEAGQTQSPKTTQTGVQCNWYKSHPSAAEQLSCLKGFRVYVGGSVINAYDYMRSLGFTDDNMIRTIQNLFPGQKPKDWNPDMLVRALGRRSM